MYRALSSFRQMVGPPLNDKGLGILFPVSLCEGIQGASDLLGCNFYSQSLLFKRLVLPTKSPL